MFRSINFTYFQFHIHIQNYQNDDHPRHLNTTTNYYLGHNKIKGENGWSLLMTKEIHS